MPIKSIVLKRQNGKAGNIVCARHWNKKKERSFTSDFQSESVVQAARTIFCNAHVFSIIHSQDRILKCQCLVEVILLIKPVITLYYIFPFSSSFKHPLDGRIATEATYQFHKCIFACYCIIAWVGCKNQLRSCN